MANHPLSRGDLIRRSLWHYRLTNLAVLLAVAVSTAVLTGAFVRG